MCSFPQRPTGVRLPVMANNKNTVFVITEFRVCWVFTVGGSWGLCPHNVNLGILKIYILYMVLEIVYCSGSYCWPTQMRGSAGCGLFKALWWHRGLCTWAAWDLIPTQWAVGAHIDSVTVQLLVEFTTFFLSHLHCSSHLLLLLMDVSTPIMNLGIYSVEQPCPVWKILDQQGICCLSFNTLRPRHCSFCI